MRALVIARLGSALILRAGERILRSRTFPGTPITERGNAWKKFRRDAETNTREACATRT